MKILMALMLAACGKSECDDYAAVFCTKAIACNTPPGIDARGQELCEQDVNKGTDSARITEEQCKTARDNIAPMTCDRFRDLVATFTN